MDKQYDDTARVLEINGVVLVDVKGGSETQDGCYFAGRILINGEFAGSVEEPGHGGPMEFYGLEGDDFGKALKAKLEERAEGMLYAGMPKLALGADGLAARLMERHEALKEFRGKLSQKLVWVDGSGEIMESKRLPKATLDEIAHNDELRQKKMGERIVLNALEERTAFDLFFRGLYLEESLSYSDVKNEINNNDKDGPSL